MGLRLGDRMGAMKQHFEEIEAKHKLEVSELEMRIHELETELSIVRGKYDSLCSRIKKNSNEKRNEGDDFLRNYAKNWK